MNATEISVPALVIGGGPAGLMAAQQLARELGQIVVCDAMPSIGRKFLRAGIGGLNLTHSESEEKFRAHFSGSVPVNPWLDEFGTRQVLDWATDLGMETFVGSSGRIFPTQMKASPLLRAWLGRLQDNGVQFRTRHRWTGLQRDGDDYRFHFTTPDGGLTVRTGVCVLALGGGSWSRLGSDGQWRALLSKAGIESLPLRPANCGFDFNWTEHFNERFAGAALKAVRLSVDAGDSVRHRIGEATISRQGIEGSLVYHFSALIRDQIDSRGQCTLHWDLLPDWTDEKISRQISLPQGKMSMSNFLRKRLGLSAVKIALLRELAPDSLRDRVLLAQAIKHLPMTVRATRPVDEAISTAGGIPESEMTRHLMLRRLPGVFCAGEMLDWEAPTGGYLLTACLASGRIAGLAALNFTRETAPDDT
ncbi:NAD(P)/FAD-dependent oxidoreductase [Pseudohongiella spirulinae]|uniref:NAD(P)/FAD-dependent oxidoreductase n=1 Tax=Pseudohongiella spirulinae TaxID=1249552 RepID=UPI002FF76C8C